MTQASKIKRSASQPYNGHPNWNLWNVHLWISSDYWAYMQGKVLVRLHGLNRAVDILHEEYRHTQTPDGGRYTRAALRHTLRCIRD